MEASKKWVLVTGAASGIGKAITEHLSKNGWGVYATDIDEKDGPRKRQGRQDD